MASNAPPYDQYGQYNTGYQGYIPPQAGAPQHEYQYAASIHQTNDYQPLQPNSVHNDLTTDSTIRDADPYRCRDKFCAAIFILHLIAMFSVAFYSLSTLETNSQAIGDTAKVISVCVFISGCVGIFFACIWLQVLKSCAGAVISTSYGVLIGFSLLSGIVSLATGVVGGAITGFLVAAFAALAYFCIRHRIPFTEKLIEPAITATTTYYGVYVAAFAMAVLSVLYSIFFAVAITNINIDASGDTDDDALGVLWAVFAISFIWTIETLNNITFVTTAGAVGTWWLQNATYSAFASLKRASVYNLGSIALGSFFVALITYANYLIRSLRHESRDAGLGQQIAIACLQCLGNLLEEALRFFNRFAYAQIALYGKDFVPAAKDAFDLLKAHGFDAMINDDLTGMATGLGVFLCSLMNLAVVGVASYFYVSRSESIDFEQSYVVLFVFCFLVGGYTASIILNQINAAVTTTFVLWAQEPDAMSQTRVQEFNSIQAAREKAYR